MCCAFMHQMGFGAEVPTPSISLFILYIYGPHISENSSAVCKAGNPIVTESCFPICLLSFPLLTTLKRCQSSKWNNTTSVHSTMFWQWDNTHGYKANMGAVLGLPHPCGSERFSWMTLHMRTKTKCKSLAYGAAAVSWAGKWLGVSSRSLCSHHRQEKDMQNRGRMIRETEK